MKNTPIYRLASPAPFKELLGISSGGGQRGEIPFPLPWLWWR